MKLVVALPLLFVGSLAHADATKSTWKALAAGADVCKEINTGGGKCKAGPKLKSKTFGDVTVYQVDGDMVRVALAFDDGKQTLLAAPVEDTKSNSGAGNSVDIVKVTPRVRELKVGGKDAVALELNLTYEHSLNEAPKGAKVDRWQTHTFVVCSRTGCVTQSYGARDEKCTAKLSKTGSIEHTCTATDDVSL